MSKPYRVTRIVSAALLAGAVSLPVAAQEAGVGGSASVAVENDASADARVEVGVLSCSVEGGTGFIIGSTKDLVCELERPGVNETYRGTIDKFGLDIGTTTQGVIAWTVLAPTTDIGPGALEGEYAGVSAEATAGAGIGANVLVGGSDDSVMLQPVSVQAQTGLNLALGVASMSLRASN